jgi:hypothetical protein
MSWNPDIWIRKEDFKRLEDKLKYYDVWEFNIAGIAGCVIKAGEFSSTHMELDEILSGISHWILNGEGKNCVNCIEWGNQIYEYKGDE